MNPGNVLITNTFNAVVAETVIQNCRALQGFTYCNLELGILLLEIVTGTQAAATAASEESTEEA